MRALIRAPSLTCSSVLESVGNPVFTAENMRRLVAVSMLLALSSSGCGSVYYAASVNAASARVEQARSVGAERHAPYEFYYAQEHLRQAQIEASEASYGDAVAFAETAEEFAQKAIDISAGKVPAHPASAAPAAAKGE
jgi:hypothetical protein